MVGVAVAVGVSISVVVVAAVAVAVAVVVAVGVVVGVAVLGAVGVAVAVLGVALLSKGVDVDANTHLELEKIVVRLARAEARLADLEAATPKMRNGVLLPLGAPPEDLDGKYGDPEVKFPPRELVHLKGRFASQMSSDECYDMARDCVRRAKQDADKAARGGDDPTKLNPGQKAYSAADYEKFAHYKRKDASLFVGWAQRHEREEDRPAKPPAGRAQADDLGGDEIPF